MSALPKDDGSFAQRVSSSYRQLSQAASCLNQASDELGKSIGALDAALEKLDLGITTWSRLDRWEDPFGNYASRYLGYARVKNRWGIALRTVAGNTSQPATDAVEEWLFDEAPRALRVAAVEKLPLLFDNLLREADAVIRKVQAQTQCARQLASALADPPGGAGSCKS